MIPSVTTSATPKKTEATISLTCCGPDAAAVHGVTCMSGQYYQGEARCIGTLKECIGVSNGGDTSVNSISMIACS